MSLGGQAQQGMSFKKLIVSFYLFYLCKRQTIYQSPRKTRLKQVVVDHDRDIDVIWS